MSVLRFCGLRAASVVGAVTGWEAYAGQLAGMATSVLWTATSLLFTAAGRRIGPVAVNGSRIAMAIVLNAVTHRLMTGHWIPGATGGQVMFLAASGIVGLTVGDQALFTAFVDIGPRQAMLIMTSSPLFAALFGWVALGETLGVSSMFGMLVTVGGIAWVVLERPSQRSARSLHHGRGVVLAFVAAACQAGGLLLSKQGIGHGWLPTEQHISPQSATLIRMFFAGVGVVPIVLIHSYRQRARGADAVDRLRVGSKRAGYLLAACGSVTGPFLGVWMSLVASDRASLGVAQTLCSLAPIFILPVALFAFKERASARAWFGALIAVSGSAILFIDA